jgi:hypothetical protein
VNPDALRWSATLAGVLALDPHVPVLLEPPRRLNRPNLLIFENPLAALTEDASG